MPTYHVRRLRSALLVMLAGPFLFNAAGDAQHAAEAFAHEKATISAALTALEQQAAQTSAPEKVLSWLAVARAENAALAAASEPTAARRAFRRAGRALARVSRWLQEREPEEQPATDAERLERLRQRLQGLNEHMTSLESRATAAGVSLNTSAATGSATAAKLALDQRDLATVRARLGDLVRSMDAIEDLIAVAADSQAAP